MTEVTRCSCWHPNFVPKKLSAPAPGLYTCKKSWKNVYKIRLQRMFLKRVANNWSDKRFLLTSKFCPLGVVCLWPAAIYIYKIMKRCVWSQRLKNSFWNLQQITKVMRPSCWHQNFGPNGLPGPAQGLYSCIKSWKNVHKIYSNHMTNMAIQGS